MYSSPTIAKQFLDIKWTSLEGNFNVADLLKNFKNINTQLVY